MLLDDIINDAASDGSAVTIRGPHRAYLMMLYKGGAKLNKDGLAQTTKGTEYLWHFDDDMCGLYDPDKIEVCGNLFNVTFPDQTIV